MPTDRSLRWSATGLVVLLCCGLLPLVTGAGVAAAGTTVTRIPVAFTVENPCVPYDGSNQDLGDEGEFVDFHGELLQTSQVVTDATGTDHEVVRYQLQGVEGVGRVSGLRYRDILASVLVETTAPDFSPLTQTLVGQGQFVAPGPGNDFVGTSLLHITLNANGECTAFFTIEDAQCR